MRVSKIAFAIYVVIALAGCNVREGSSYVDQDAKLSRYTHAIIYDSQTASFLELQLMKYFRDHGFKVVGENEFVPGKTVGVRYVANVIGSTYTLAATVEDVTTDKTLFTVEGIGKDYDEMWGGYSPDRERAHHAFLDELQKVLSTAR